MEGVQVKYMRQTERSSRWGAVKLSYMQSMPYLTLWNFVMITITAYNTTIKGFCETRGIPVELWHFVVLLVVGSAFVMALEYRYSMPSTFKFAWDQSYKHSTLLPGKLEEIMGKLDELASDIKDLKLRYGIDESDGREGCAECGAAVADPDEILCPGCAEIPEIVDQY